MLRLFSSIRKSLLAENKTVKYAKYAVGEFLLIVAGILVALQIQNWNERRLERTEEQQILERILGELNKTVDDFTGFRLSNARVQKEALRKVAMAFEGDRIEDNFDFLTQVVNAARMGWGQPNMPVGIYEELLNTAKFSLISNVQLRDNIRAYYNSVITFEGRADFRVNDMAKIIYELVPRDSVKLDRLSDHRVEPGLSKDVYAALADKVLSSNLNEYLVAAKNRNLLIEAWWIDLTNQAQVLMAEIEVELNN